MHLRKSSADLGPLPKQAERESCHDVVIEREKTKTPRPGRTTACSGKDQWRGTTKEEERLAEMGGIQK